MTLVTNFTEVLKKKVVWMKYFIHILVYLFILFEKCCSIFLIKNLYNLIFVSITDYITKLCGEPKEKAVTQLLSHLPLLRTGNADAKTAYLKIIPQVLSYSIDNGVHIEESRQLLSFSLIHPAITCEERSQFTMWLGYLEERFTYSIYHQNRQNNFQSQSSFSNRSGEEGLQQQQQGVPAHMNLANSGCLNGWNDRSAGSDSMPALTLDGGSTERLIPILTNYAKPGANRSNNASSSNGDRGAPSHSVHGKLAGHVPLHATSSAPPNTGSIQGKIDLQYFFTCDYCRKVYSKDLYACKSEICSLNRFDSLDLSLTQYPLKLFEGKV